MSYAKASENRAHAIVLMLAAAFFVAGATLLAKSLGTHALGDPLHPFQVTFGRFLFALIALCLVALVFRPQLRRPHLPTHFARTFCGATGITLLFAASAQMPLADANAISFLNPVFALALAALLLKERVGRIRWTAAGMAFLGALILIRPGLGTFQPAALLALASAVMIGAEITLIKRLSGHEPTFTILLTNNAIGLVLASLAVSFVWLSPSPGQWAALAGLGCSIAAAQFCYTNALARAEASFIVPFSYTALIFAGLWDAIVFGILPDALSFAGAATIIAGGALLAWREGKLQALRR